LELRVPELLPGSGRAIQGDAVALTTTPASATDPGLGHFDLAYLDPPYNQHRYFTNYHVWETLVAWDAPEAYGVARKRLDARDPSTRSAFNSKRTMPAALASVVHAVDCDLLVLSYNNESWLGMDELEAMCADRGAVATLAFDSARYVGARIGIFDPSGRKVGRVSHLSNQELVVIAGEGALVRRVVEAADAGTTAGTVAVPVTGAAAAVVAAGRVDRLQQAT
jgi:adenine-specific DNA-methyltransferase